MTLSLGIVLFFLGVSLVLYLVFGGADFGAGVIEILWSRKERDRLSSVVSHAIAPVWEANHVWLILAIVILFMGFPSVYALLSTALHIPLSLMLFGIVMRGAAFAFRHYDVHWEEAHRWYARTFRFASVWTPFWLGVIAGAVIAARQPVAADDFAEVFIWSWFHPLGMSMGLFTLALCAHLGALFLYGEDTGPSWRTLIERSIRGTQFFSIATGLLVFICAEIQGVSLLSRILQHPGSLMMIAVATGAIPLLRLALEQGNAWGLKLLGAVQVSAILLGWYALQFPEWMRIQNWNEYVAPEATLRTLAGALIVGATLIFPSLAWLFVTLKTGSSYPREKTRAAP